MSILKSKVKLLQEINGLVDGVIDPINGAKAEVTSPVGWAPASVGDIYVEPGPMPLQSKVASLIKINNHLSNITSTDGDVLAII